MNINSLNTSIMKASLSDDKKLKESKDKELSKDQKDLLEAANQLEGEFLKILFKEMKKTVPDSEFMPKSSASKMMEDMYFEKVAESVTEKGKGVGIAKAIYEQLSRKL